MSDKNSQTQMCGMCGSVGANNEIASSVNRNAVTVRYVDNMSAVTCPMSQVTQLPDGVKCNHPNSCKKKEHQHHKVLQGAGLGPAVIIYLNPNPNSST